MYAVTAESPWEHIREWVTREAVHPWKIQQLKRLYLRRDKSPSLPAACLPA
ncbi:hypothetical protein J6590_046490 [Homalodisca vitripennis]|nr:hypothetical protein J6590_046490 [Homalodisca vitripennis]